MRVEIPYTYLPQTEFCHLIRMFKQKPVSTYYVIFSKQHKPRHSNKKYADTRVCQKKNTDTRTSDTQLITHRAGRRNVIEILQSVTHSLTSTNLHDTVRG